jgi:hypothetical protein
VAHITGGNFAQSSITINGWLRDFLWACKWSPELAAACEVWKEITFNFPTIDKLVEPLDKIEKRVSERKI